MSIEITEEIADVAEEFAMSKYANQAHRAAALLEHVVKLRAALRPFAALAEHYPMTKTYGNRPTSGVLFEVSSGDKTAGYTVEDLHAAAALVRNTDSSGAKEQNHDDASVP